jgi:hypothetical protein
MKTYVIERSIPGVDKLDRDQLRGAAATSNAALAKLDDKVKWLQSFVVADQTYCIYEAENEGLVHEHARLSGFPANKVTEVTGMISPATANA